MLIRVSRIKANAKKYSLDENTAIQLTKMNEYRKVKEKYESIAEQYQRTSNKVNADFDHKFLQNKHVLFQKNLFKYVGGAGPYHG